jgi:dephospho-CoA kinase
MHAVLKVGLTGNIAAGKSTVAQVWQELGGTVIDADRLARQAVEPGTPALREIAAAWGPGVLDPSGALDRAALRKVVFADAEARARLEGIIHPAVGVLRDREYERARGRGERMVVADIPLLFEVGLADEFDVVVLVDAPESVREERLVRDRGLSKEDAQRMIGAQMPSAAKRARAHYIIDNSGTPAELRRRAIDVWGELQRRVLA